MSELQLFEVDVCSVSYVIAASSVEAVQEVLDASGERDSFESEEEWLDRKVMPVPEEDLDSKKFRSDEDGLLHSLREALADSREPGIVACSEW